MGGNLGGLAGADAKCKQLAEAVGVTGKTWVAYLSTTQGPTHARMRIGNGPWFNSERTDVRGEPAGSASHDRCRREPRAVRRAKPADALFLTETGQRVPADRSTTSSPARTGRACWSRTRPARTGRPARTATTASGRPQRHAPMRFSASWNCRPHTAELHRRTAWPSRAAAQRPHLLLRHELSLRRRCPAALDGVAGQFPIASRRGTSRASGASVASARVRPRLPGTVPAPARHLLTRPGSASPRWRPAGQRRSHEAAQPFSLHPRCPGRLRRL